MKTRKVKVRRKNFNFLFSNFNDFRKQWEFEHLTAAKSFLLNKSHPIPILIHQHNQISGRLTKQLNLIKFYITHGVGEGEKSFSVSLSTFFLLLRRKIFSCHLIIITENIDLQPFDINKNAMSTLQILYAHNEIVC